ncbi:MAG: RnfABCDGE type electron transport complex subunit C [Anaerorhabdus sp.]
MSFIIGPMRKHLEGHKELTNGSDVTRLIAPEVVFIPLVNGNSVAELLVSEGDKVKIGTKIAVCKGNFEVPLFSSVSGIVKGVKQVMHSSLKPVDHLEILNDGLDEKEDLPKIDYTNASPAELVEFTKNSGIIGCGGASFPTYVKYLKPENLDTLIINAVECEPYITADYKEIKHAMDEFVVGVKMMMKMASAKKAFIGIKKDKKEFIALVQKAIQSDETIEVIGVSDVYPMGWERTLVYEITKKRYDRLPGEVGCVVNNATTAISLAQAALSHTPIVEKIVTVSGDGIKNPQNVLVRVGTPVSAIIHHCGGYAAEDVNLIAGGPMMGRTVTNDEFVVGPSNNAITVLINKDIPSMSCLRCGKCTDHCPAALQPVRINQAEKTKNFDMLNRLAVDQCVECGMCTYICPSKLDVTEGVRRAKRYMALKRK